MANSVRHRIGQIFLDGGFISKKELDLAFEEQKLVKELLGQVLVRMGVLKEQDIDAPLKVQEHLSTVGDAVKIAAGERQLLGALLVQSGRITGEQLDRAIAEQKWTGERLGDVFTRLGMLTEPQLAALLEFQQNQSNTSTYSPLRLGELLIATGNISRDQLEDALHKQRFSHKKIGEVLLEEGYVQPDQLKSGFRLQKMLVKSVLAAILSLSLSAPAMASSVSLHWNANSESDVAGYRVYHNAGATILEGTTPLDVINQTTATIDDLDPGITYTFAVTAYNNAGIESLFSNSLTIEEQAPPTVDITSPSAGVNVSGAVSINVDAADNVGVTKVEFFINDQLKASETSAPYFYSWDTSSVTPGAYTLMAKAYDAAGNVSQSSRSVTVVNDSIPPTVAMTSPVNNAVLSGTATISAGASDNVSVSRVEFYGNGVLLYATNVSPYNFSWDTRTVSNGTYTINAWAFDNAGNSTQSSSVTVTVNNVVADAVAPAVISFSLPATATSLTVPVSGLAATDAVGVTGYLVTESASTPSAGAAGWSASAPASFTFASAGVKTAYAWAKDAAGNVSSGRVASITITLPDITAPAVTGFSIPVTATALTIPVYGLSASDAVGVTGYLITESASAPSASASGWSATAPTSYTFATAGAKTVYAWAKDAAGNVSSSRSAAVTITLPDAVAPTVSSFSLPATAASLTVPVSGLAASDAVGVTGYLITESATAPSAGAAGWSASAPASFTFASAGVKTAYAWAKDAAGNVSSSRSSSVTITLPDVIAPAVTSFSFPVAATSLTVPVSGFAATDSVGVTGYFISEGASTPSASASGWSATAPTSFTFSSAGAKTAYAWAKDAAGNVSSVRSASVTITLPDVIAPAVASFSLPATATSLTVPVYGLAASDAVGVTGYLITESASAPSATASGWSAGAPTSYTFSSAGVKTAYAWAKDAAGNVSSARSASVTITLADAVAPAVTSFSLPATATSLTVSVSGLAASDAVGVTGYLITESASAPSASASGWSATAPTSYTFSSAGAKTAYAWAKDAAGNVSSARSAAVTITLPDAVAPTVASFSLPATAASLTVPVSGLAASDAVGVTGYLIT
ncbi:MAG: Ig-like domain-containing protein, partial [Desulfuromonadaceae bacterium]|nr:Ig-like domain-containing protein [Desulfuromonadaceae bacterium]